MGTQKAASPDRDDDEVDLAAEAACNLVTTDITRAQRVCEARGSLESGHGHGLVF